MSLYYPLQIHLCRSGHSADDEDQLAKFPAALPSSSLYLPGSQYTANGKQRALHRFLESQESESLEIIWCTPTRDVQRR